MPKLACFWNIALFSCNHNCLRLAHQNLLAADLRPGYAAVGKDIFSAAHLQNLILQRGFPGSEQRLSAELQKYADLRPIGILFLQRGILLRQFVGGGVGLIGIRAPFSQLTQCTHNIVNRHGVEPQHGNAQRLELIDLPFGVTSAPGHH